MKITKQQIASIHALLPNKIKNNKIFKAEVISQFTQDETKTSTKDLSFDQANQLILKLGGSPHKKTKNKYGYFDKTNAQHKYLLSLCMQIGWTDFKPGIGTIADTDQFGHWMQKSGYLHKPLKDYTAAELPKLVAQFQEVVKNTKL